MGLDCGLFVFPPGRAPRVYWMDRAYCFDDSPVERWPATKLREWILDMPPDESGERTGYVAHWRNHAIQQLDRIIYRWGPDTPCAIYDENHIDLLDNERRHPAIVRWRKREELAGKRERDAQRAKDGETLQRVREELAEKHRAQFSG